MARLKGDETPLNSPKGGKAGSLRSRLPGIWAGEIGPATYKISCTIAPGRPEFYKSLRELEKRGLSLEEIQSLFAPFAAAIRAGTISVDGKNAWYVFTRAWPRIRVQEASAARGGPGLTRDDFLPPSKRTGQ
jgi:hypothetical protein